MNNAAALLVPAPVVQISTVASAASVEQRHQRMISASADLQEALLEDLTTEGMNHIKGLVDAIAADLAYCRNTNPAGEVTPT